HAAAVRGARFSAATAGLTPSGQLAKVRRTMAETPPRRLEGAPFPVFPLACWALGLIAFCQLIVAGLALAVRFEDSREVRIVEKEVPKLVAGRIPAPAPETTAPDAAVVARPPVLEPAPERSVASLLPPPPPPTPVGTPEVADPR